MSPPLPSIGAPPLPVVSSRIPPSSGRREGDSFDPASRRAPPSLLLFASSGRRDGDSFDRASRLIARRGAPPRCCSCLRRPGGAKETRSIAGRGGGRGGIVRRGGGMNRVSCGRREGDSFDRASWPAPTALVVRVVRAACSTARHGAPPRTRSEGCWGKGHKGRGVVCQDSWRAGAGETRARRKWFFFDARCMRIRTSLGQKKTQGKIRAMQSHGQVMPPCHCIAKIATEERGSCR